MKIKKIRRPLTLLLTVVSGACMLSFTRQIRPIRLQKTIKHVQNPEMVLRWNAAAVEAKYHYVFWRPVTAIRMADQDGNPDTKGDSTWNVLVAPTLLYLTIPLPIR